MKVRALKRKEIKKLKKKGIDLLKGENMNDTDTVDLVLSMVFPDKESQAKLDEMDYDKVLELYSQIIQKTFGATKEEEENL